MEKVIILHGEVPPGAPQDERDVEVQAEAVSRSLAALGFEPVPLALSLDLEAAAGALRSLSPGCVLNLVESVGGRGRWIHLAPALLESLGLPYTGAGPDAMYQTSNKLVAKRLLRAAGVPTPPWISAEDPDGVGPAAGSPADGAPWIVKSVWEHASVGLDDGAILRGQDGDGAGGGRAGVLEAIARRRARLGGAAFAERYIEGREFNLALLAGPRGPEVLPPAEIRFEAFPPGKARIVDYRAKWEEESFEYRHTPRRFDFPAADRPLLDRLTSTAERCWRLFDLRGYARVDFRVDSEGLPWVLEVNANPCLSPDAGLAAAAREAGLSYEAVIDRILRDRTASHVPNPSRSR